MTKEELKEEIITLNKKIDNFDSDDLSEDEIVELSFNFTELLNQTLGPIELIPGRNFYNRVLAIEKLDPYLYKQLFDDYLDSNSSDLKNTISFCNLLESRQFLEDYLEELENSIKFE